MKIECYTTIVNDDSKAAGTYYHTSCNTKLKNEERKCKLGDVDSAKKADFDPLIIAQLVI